MSLRDTYKSIISTFFDFYNFHIFTNVVYKRSTDVYSILEMRTDLRLVIENRICILRNN